MLTPNNKRTLQPDGGGEVPTVEERHGKKTNGSDGLDAISISQVEVASLEWPQVAK